MAFIEQLNKKNQNPKLSAISHREKEWIHLNASIRVRNGIRREGKNQNQQQQQQQQAQQRQENKRMRSEKKKFKKKETNKHWTNLHRKMKNENNERKTKNIWQDRERGREIESAKTNTEYNWMRCEDVTCLLMVQCISERVSISLAVDKILLFFSLLGAIQFDMYLSLRICTYDVHILI